MTSFNAADVGAYRIVGTKGQLHVDPAYEYAEGLGYELTVDGKTTRKRIGKRDQFAPELLYFSDCILKDREPEPSGEEGLQDVRIVQALYESAETGKAVAIPPFERTKRPTSKQRDLQAGCRRSRSWCTPAAANARLARFEQHSVGSPGGPRIGSRFVGVEIGPSGDGADEDAVALDAPKHLVGCNELAHAGGGPIGGGGDSPVTHRAPGYRPIVHSRADQISRRRHREHARGRAVFPRRRTGCEVPATPLSLRLGAPVSQRYRDVEDALIGLRLGGNLRIIEARAPCATR